MGLLLGAIGDDMTGSTDLALMLGKQGISVIQYIGIPRQEVEVKDAQAAVVALKSRTTPVEEAVSESLGACEWLLKQGARQIFFKYCSTFDSTEKGNIGPVAEALLERLNGEIAVFCPAFPENARSVYNGHLFVGQDLLSESSMRDHPLTPMTDSNLVRFLGKQVSRADQVGLVPYGAVDQGPDAIEESLQGLVGKGHRFAVVDAIMDRHLMDIGRACADLKLVTGGSGVAMGLPENFRQAGLLTKDSGLEQLPKLEGGAGVLAGSCSLATRRQVKRMSRTQPAMALDPIALAEGNQTIEQIVEWAETHISTKPVLVYSTAEPEDVAGVQAKLGREKAGTLVEDIFAAVAVELRNAGMKKLIVAGGETSGAVLNALGVTALRIGPEIAPGVPWTISAEEPAMCLALKSGNFGDEDFFEKALSILP
ncbi:MAG: four-carbon acid sugar kinase family protein [Deltaproteobacteria bacterium]|nr:four-carbon acid sugar kinase family protein [Deltaproteobacteria bacterium]